MFGVAFLYAGSLWFLFLVELLPVDGVGQVACKGSLAWKASIDVLVGGAESLPSGVQ